MRVAVAEDAVPFVKVGKSAFAKFVAEMDPELRPGDECLLVGPNDELLGVGRALMNRREALSFKRGVAVKLRQGIEGHEKADDD